MEQVETIHSRSLDLLESFGINFLLPEARELLGKAGATLDPDRPRVRFDREMLMEVVAPTPRQFPMDLRWPDR